MKIKLGRRTVKIEEKTTHLGDVKMLREWRDCIGVDGGVEVHRNLYEKYHAMDWVSLQQYPTFEGLPENRPLFSARKCEPKLICAVIVAQLDLAVAPMGQSRFLCLL